MMRFEDIIAWQKAQDLAIEIYSTFGEISNYSFRNQICSAAISISNNIAEGFDRNTNKEFTRFLYIAKGSCAEVKSMIYLAEKMNMIESNCAHHFLNKCDEISKIIRGLIKSLLRTK